MSATKTATHWDELTEAYDPVMSSDPAYRSLLKAIVGRLQSPRRILDLGCGTGALTQLCHRFFPEASIVGLDPALKMLEQARSRITDRNITFVEGTAANLAAFPSGSFDAVVSNFALHHLSHDNKKVCAREVMRVLQPGGIFVNGDQHCAVMGDVNDPQRILETLDLLTNKARYYFLNAGINRMLLQLQLLPRFISQDGEILATPEFWVAALDSAGFTQVEIDVIEPAALMNRVISGVRPAEQGIG
ncbi:class I SAM-dependent methyltransferase [Bradyrhizobium diazoefficiens]|uniref:class I SAM-dependent methyltransferase n=1 Tax=Bradyrhizobium diazoefficiens TaxID=1355477 RepID=UPI001B8C24D3|nr:class I SAM-dependent methyltransferase [Bradyrhizobium diazoefficiens]MBR0865888.1 class I SAM-dependent methyltransferase [Bradyrhizobium diazoefficiens]MBR0890418.1 class I SAM-dependent methyltransferase [Bradyrhizobium diazoefficiens]MBR0922188.1 class I SAM-dependent methyltransferase [Bradyrhizobium diazoefficiens]